MEESQKIQQQITEEHNMVQQYTTVIREIDHIPVNTYWRIFQKYMVYWSAEFCVDGWIISDHVYNCWPEYFEQLFQVDPPAISLDTRGVPIFVSDPTISKEPPTVTEAREVISRLSLGPFPGPGEEYGHPSLEGESHSSVYQIFTNILLKPIHDHHQRLQLSGFTPGKSTTVHTLALRDIICCEFSCELLAAYIDHKVFDSVHCESLGLTD
ncbi:uncharacterized protein LOC134783569 [Penaeus indicus]|uniref:uncharacterized protein LOC134783569 n=1 Tax=Penaeus indicus TaxID=29960 RepID=UPI00300C72FF